MQATQQCAHCTTETRCSRRDFSEQAWSVLLAWKEVNKSSIDQPLCGDCYDELREILIDRADELAQAISNPIALRNNAEDAPKKRMSAPAEAKKKLPIAGKKVAAAKKTKRPKRVA